MTLNRVLCSAVVAALFAPGVVMTAEPSVKDVQHARHEHYEELGDAFKTAAKKVNDASVNQEQWVPAGSGPEAGKTRALPDIWAKPTEFKAAIKMFSDAAPKLHAAASAGDVAAIKTAFGDVGKSCKNCHDQFRAKED
jgi:cytochrome c556